MGPTFVVGKSVSHSTHGTLFSVMNIKLCLSSQASENSFVLCGEYEWRLVLAQSLASVSQHQPLGLDTQSRDGYIPMQM